MSERFTIVFEGDIRKFSGNPLKTETPFGVPYTVAVGDIIEQFNDLQDARAHAPETNDCDNSGCPFCGRDPFHRSDFGEPLAVDCCDLGDLLFRGARLTPETVGIGWDDFTKIANRLRGLDRSSTATAAPTAHQHPDNDPAEIALRDEISAENLRLIDHIANRIGLPHDQELTTQLFDDWYAECRSSSTARNDEPVTANYGKQHLSGPAVEAIEIAQDTEELAAPPSPDTVREAAQAVIDRWETPAWKDRPATATYINALRAALSSAPVAPTAPVAGTKDQWQDISTAPKDGRKVWIYGGRNIAPSEAEADGEWWRRMAAEGNTAVPTHWMEHQIPAPPSKSAPVFKAAQNTAESDPAVTQVCAGADTVPRNEGNAP